MYKSREGVIAVAMSVVDLFAGCGGLSKGFELAGYDLKAAFEFWPVAADCYEANFSHPVYREDLSDVAAAEALLEKINPDMIIGGPPCQDFSHAGKRVEAGRASLTESYAAIIAAIKPKCFVMENVDRAQRSNAYASAKKIFREAGYGITERVLTASYCGVPQRRKRFFCIGVLDEEDGVLDSYLSKNLSDQEMTVRDYLGDALDTEFYYRHPRNYSRRGIFSIDEPAPTMRGVNRPIPKGYPGHPKDACQLNESVRPLTTLERSLIQTFPPTFKWVGSKTDCEQMIGNAVPVNLAKYVAEAVKDYFAVEEQSIAEDKQEAFVGWLQEEKEMQAKSAKDVRSRLMRANDILDYDPTCSVAIYLAQLGELQAFADQSKTVQSQMRRAVRLYAEYAVSK